MSDAQDDRRVDYVRQIGQQVRARREATGLSQTGLERAAELRPTTVIDLDRGEGDLDVQDLYRLAGVLGVYIRDLLPAT